MNKKHAPLPGRNRRSCRKALPLAIAAMAGLGGAAPAMAFEIESGNPDVKMRWDNTVKYSNAWRLEDRSRTLTSDINQDDGNRNFGRGLISNRIDLLSEFDFSYKGSYGLRLSGAGWYDTVYQRSNDNNSPATINQLSRPSDEFVDATRDLHGGRAEWLDAFVYANGERGNVRLGRHSILYGETLFFGANGIAAAQSPTDIVKLLSVPNSQFKEIILPVNQVSGQIQLTDTVSLGAYYQFEFRKNRIPGVGSYFSGADVLGSGTERFLFAPGVGVPRVEDGNAPDSGQGGVQLRWRPEGTDIEFGFYAVRYHDKNFQVYLRPVAGELQMVYPEDVRAYGVSFSTEIADFNLAGEFSVRRNTPLVSGPVVDMSPTGVADNDSNALYAIGNSAHANLSAIFFLNRSKFWDNASLVGEIAWNRRTSITKNAAELDPNTSRDAWGLRFVFEPQWFQAAPGLDLSMPIGLGYNPKGNSSVVQLFNGGVEHGGDLSIGVKGVYQQVWRGGINYTHYIGRAGNALGTDANLTFRQNYADRDFISVSLQRTF